MSFRLGAPARANPISKPPINDTPEAIVQVGSLRKTALPANKVARTISTVSKSRDRDMILLLNDGSFRGAAEESIANADDRLDAVAAGAEFLP